MEEARERVWGGEKVDIEGDRDWLDSRGSIRDSKWLAVFCHSDGQVRKIERRRQCNTRIQLKPPARKARHTQ